MKNVKGMIFSAEGRFVPGCVTFDSGKITDVAILEEKDLDESERARYVLPGLVDIHSHGCFGHDTCDADPEGLRAMLDFEEAHGTTSWFPTTMTFNEEKLAGICAVIAEAAHKDTRIKGIYLEGPFISAEKCGAQNPAYIMKPDYAMLERLQETAEGLIKFVAVAPETEEALDCIAAGSGQFVFSIAHTNADYDTAMAAIDAGAAHVTHFYNAMPAYSHRAPGVIGAAMDSDNVKVELIADGIHVHPAVVRNTFRYFGADRVILISDSMEATGMSDGQYSLGGQDVFVKGRRAELASGTIAGSASTLFDCVREAVRMGVSLEEAVISATKTPAKEAGIFDRVGSIETGKDADLLIVSRELEIITVIRNII